MKRARETGKDVEVKAERTAESTTWAQPDGHFRTRIHSDTIRARTDDGWQKIDTDLEKAKGGYAPKAVNDPLLFSAGSTGGHRAQGRRTGEDSGGWTPLVTMAVGDHEMTVQWPGPLPEPLVSGPRALYEDIRPGIDLLLTARDSGYSHLLIIHDNKAAQDPLLKQLRYRLDSPTLDFHLDQASGTVQALTPEGEEMAASPTQFAWDSAGKPATTMGETPTAPQENNDTLNLAGLAGPQPGTHDARLKTALTDGALTITPDAGLLTGEDTVYPVFIDPSFKGHKTNWTLLYAKYADSSFWNGQNYNDGTNEARVGYEEDTGGLSRSVFTFEHDSTLNGAEVQSAYLRALQTYSWGCAAREYRVWQTGKISSTSTWSNQPTWKRVISENTNGHGYDSSCPDKWVAHDITSLARDAAAGGWSTITLGLRATNESDTNAWKKFRANGENSPYIDITYNHRPDDPTGLTMSPGPGCDRESPYGSVGKSDLTFRARGSDPDGDLSTLHFRIWPTGNFENLLYDGERATDSNGYASVTLPWETFDHDVEYTWAVRAVDEEGRASRFSPFPKPYCAFVVDHVRPPSPSVTSAAFPPPGEDGSTWSTIPFGNPGDFTFSVTSAAEDVAAYEYSLNEGSYDQPVAAEEDGTATVSLKPSYAGPNHLYVRAVDSSGNRSARTRYRFHVTPPSGLDAPGDLNGDGHPDLVAIDDDGNLRTYPADDRGDPHIHGTGAHDAGQALPDGYWADATDEPALISHTGDWFPGDGITDLLARMPDGKLYLYPGDGYGSFDVSQRLPVLLPDGAPDSAELTEVVTTDDITGDGHPDALAIAGDELWAFSGYTGGAFTEARLLETDTAWATRDLVIVDDLTGDNATDLLFRTGISGAGLQLRHGRADAGGGVDLASLGSAAASGTGQDEVYDTSAWLPEHLPVLRGTPDVTGDGIPDFWATAYTGVLFLYPGGPQTHGTRYEVGISGWQYIPALG
ncbi:DNRLRE domain-containing protein [Streptomyces sp. WMMC1477]|nr:DNRLRE domain-containing protein [Streptomyces sp. WMMC1477]MCZ7433244.1 DNRLRE domain-containing protein [Streptomyces sp. WMMC1477]